MIKTFSNPLTAISILESEIGIKGKILVDQQQQQYLRLVTKDEKGAFSELLSTLVNAGVEVESIDIQKPTLDDVFLKYTGTSIHEAETLQQQRGEEGWRNIRDVRRTFKQMG